MSPPPATASAKPASISIPAFRWAARPGAVAEIAGKVELDAAIEAAAHGVRRALDATLNKANRVALVLSGLADDQDDALAAIAALEAALTRAKPNATTIALGLDG